MFRAVALLDRPSSSALGMHPFVGRVDKAGLRVHGFRAQVDSAMDEQSLEQLYRSHSALRLPESLPVSGPEHKTAGWIGAEFVQKTRLLGAPELPTELDVCAVGDHGWVWFDTPGNVHDVLDQWLREATRDVFTRPAGSRDLAELMIWVFPERDETRAAVWHTRGNEAEEARLLAWYARLDRNAGNDTSEEDLQTRFSKVRETYQTLVATALSQKPYACKRARGKSPLFQANWRRGGVAT